MPSERTFRERSERVNLSLRVLKNLGFNILSFIDIYDFYIKEVAPAYFEEVFVNRNNGLSTRFRMNRVTTSYIPNVKYVIHEDAMQGGDHSKVIFSEMGSLLEKQGVFILRVMELLNALNDAGWDRSIFHFTYGKGDKGVEFYIAPTEADSTKEYMDNCQTLDF